MKINKKDTLFWVIPVFAIVIIFQAVILVRNSINKTAIETNVATSTAQKTNAVDNLVKNTIKDDLVLSLDTNEVGWKIGKSYKVTLSVLANTAKKIDAMDLFVKYDLASFKVSGLVQGEGLPKPVTSKIGDKKGLVVANLYVPGTDSYNLNKGEKKELITFNVVPSKIGEFKFEIDTGKVAKDSVTMIVEAKTAKVISFTAGELVVKVVK